MNLKKEALDFHFENKPGKIEIKCSKYINYEKLKLCYTPGVAFPCMEIFNNKQDVYKYTSKGNLVAIISNGTAVLGLGNIGALASKPVMEGKANLLKYIAGIDAIDIEIEETDQAKIIEIIEKISPTFGAVNIEDIKAPECFEIENQLINKLDIPLMHDDQHGTAIVINAALMNALKIVKKNIQDIKLVVSGAGAAAIASINLLIESGLKIENIYMFDSKGLVHNSQDKYKKKFNQQFNLTLKESLKNADVFIGLSKGDILTDEILDMNENPIIFALANPIPEIDYCKAKEIRNDAIVATGRSDFPNQINNLLAFPYIFRAALDLKIKIDNKLKLACSLALQEFVKDKINAEYIVPNALDVSLIYFIMNFIFQYYKIKIPENYFENLEYLIYGANHGKLFKPKLNIASKDQANIIENLFSFKTYINSDKELNIVDFDQILKFIQSNTVFVFLNFTTRDSSIIKKIPQEFLGIINDEKIYFNNNQRLWYILKLCEIL